MLALLGNLVATAYVTRCTAFAAAAHQAAVAVITGRLTLSLPGGQGGCLISAAAADRPVPARKVAPNARKGVSVERIVDTSLAILDARGLNALTTSEIAHRLKVSQPTLYSHVRNLDEILTRVAIRGMADLDMRVRDVVQGLTGEAALRAMTNAYLAYVREHPALYMLQQRAPATLEYWEEATRAGGAVCEVLRSYGVPESQTADAHLVFRAWIHGFVDLEANKALAVTQNDPASGVELFLRILSAGYEGLADNRFHH